MIVRELFFVVFLLIRNSVKDKRRISRNCFLQFSCFWEFPCFWEFSCFGEFSCFWHVFRDLKVSKYSGFSEIFKNHVSGHFQSDPRKAGFGDSQGIDASWDIR